MNAKPLVSVIMPAFNAAGYIKESLDSALSQEGCEFELVVIDDGSTDDTPAILESYRERIRCFTIKHQGVIAARNEALDRAKGEWLAFLDADDRWLPGHLARVNGAITEHPQAGLFYSDVRIIDQAGKLLKLNRVPGPGPDVFRTLLLRNVVPTSTAVVRRACIDEVGGFYQGLVAGSEDWDLWLRIAAHYPIYHLGEALAEYRRHSGSVVQTRARQMREDGLKVVERALEYGPDQPLTIANTARANVYLDSAMRNVTSAQAASARADLIQAIKLKPARVKAWLLLMLALLGDKAGLALVKLKRRISESGSRG